MRQDFLAAALPPMGPASFLCAVVPPCWELPPDPDFLPPLLDASGAVPSEQPWRRHGGDPPTARREAPGVVGQDRPALGVGPGPRAAAGSRPLACRPTPVADSALPTSR